MNKSKSREDIREPRLDYDPTRDDQEISTWVISNGVYAPSNLILNMNREIEHNVERWGYNSNSEMVYGSQKNNITIYSSVSDTPMYKYLAVHTLPCDIEVIQLVSYPDLLNYLNQALPIVETKLEIDLKGG